MKSILFLTTANLTTNPRLLKELILLNKHFNCTFIGFRLGNWSDEIDRQHRRALPNVRFHYLSASRKPFMKWLISSFIQKASMKIYPFFKNVLWINSFASNKRSFQLSQFTANHKNRYDFIMAHNLGALYPAWRFSIKSGIPFSFDIEDYHPGEKIAHDPVNEQARREFLMKKMLPDAAMVTYASPLIGKYSIELFGEKRITKHFLINNSFFQSEFKVPQNTSGKLKFVWFSQYVDAGRGLESLFSVMDNYSGKIELHLYGYPRAGFVEKFIEGRPYIALHGSMGQQSLFGELSKYDIGLAFDNSAEDMNRDICLTNKLWAYFQAGLFILATNTRAQKQFLDERPWAGLLTDINNKSVGQHIDWLVSNIDIVRKSRINRFEKAKNFCWANEGKKLLSELNLKNSQKAGDL